MLRMPILSRIAPLNTKPCGAVLLRGINPPFGGLSPWIGQVAYVFRTRPPVPCIAAFSLDLHVLGLPLAFILSQDQTLRSKKLLSMSFASSPAFSQMRAVPCLNHPSLSGRLRRGANP